MFRRRHSPIQNENNISTTYILSLTFNMIECLSPSSIRSYLTDRSSFHRNYILKDYDQSNNSNAIIGKIVHKYIEIRTKEKREIDIEEEFRKHLTETIISYKKGEDHEDVLRRIKNAIEAYNSMPQEDYTILGVEKKLQNKVLNFPIDLKCVCDFIYDAGNSIINVDYKTVDKFTSSTPIAYKIQGWINMLLTTVELGRQPAYMKFIELKRTKNRDKTKPPYKEVYIEYPTDEEQYLLLQLVYRICWELNGTNLMKIGKVLPNPYDTMNGPASWEYFTTSCLADYYETSDS